jgi:FAD/FMN-containing dehydrogenase
MSAVKKKDGSFDLTPLIAGAQGTLGIISEITLTTESHNPKNTLIAAYCNDLRDVEAVIHDIRKLPSPPSAVEIVDKNLIDQINKQNPNQLKEVMPSSPPKIVMLIEFDDQTDRTQSKLAKKARKILEKYGIEYKVETDETGRDKLWKIRHSATTVIGSGEGGKRALPIIDDGIVPIDQIHNFIQGIYDLFKKYNLPVSLWGHGGNANLHVQPLFDLSMLGDRQKIFKLMDDYYSLVIELGGSIAGQHNDGRLRGPYVEKLYGAEAYELFGKLKAIFDPYGTMNPGVKLDVTLDDIKPILRNEYSLEHFHDYMPRT